MKPLSLKISVVVEIFLLSAVGCESTPKTIRGEGQSVWQRQ